MRVSLCVGDYSETPYRIRGLEIAVYSVEELCYCLAENAILLDNSLMDDQLADWIAGDCGLKDLARELYPLIHKRGSLSSFVSLILEYVGFFDASVIRQVEQILKQGAGLSGIEKKKTQIDYLVENKKYAVAIREYDKLLEHWAELEMAGQELPAAGVKAALLHNKGVVLANLMIYEAAGEAFLAAYDITQDVEEYIAYLATRRMVLNDNDYIEFAAGNRDGYEMTLELEKRMDKIREDFHKQPEFARLQSRKEKRNGSSKQSYYDENENLTQTLKNTYREFVCE